jgi:hypothetical protein
MALFTTFNNLLLNASEQQELSNLEAYFARVIDDTVGRCEAKSKMRDSWSPKVRHSAAVACLKSAYFKTYKDELIQGMIADGVGKKAYKVNAYLNKRFFSIVKKQSEPIALY